MLTPKHLEILTARGLDAEILARFGVESAQKPGGEWIMIPFQVGGVTVNRKHRTIAGEKKFYQEAGAKKVFWNQDVITDPSLADEPLIITEGEFDALSAIQAGFVRTVSVPDGAPAEQITKEDSQKYTYLLDVLGDIRKSREVILATDSDGPGTNLMNDLAIRIGKARCKWVPYPKGCKDLNDALRQYGIDGVKKSIQRARWFEIDGVARMDDLPEMETPRQYRLGMPVIDDHYIPRLGDFVVITGIPGHGKSTWINEIAARLSLRYGLVTCFASFEQTPKTDHRRALRTYFNGKKVIDQTPAEIARADEWIQSSFCFMVPKEGTDTTLDWVLERCQVAVIRFGAKVIVIDPWNEMDHLRPPDMTITEYVGFAIKQFKAFAKQYQVHLIIAAHPAKMMRDKGTGEIPIPSLYDISDCYSSDTEVLTKRGWLLHSEVTTEDEVMTFDPETDALSWGRPSRVVEQDYSGPMINFKGYGFDLLVSPNHRMVVKPAWDDPVGTQKLTGIGRPTIWPKGVWSFAKASEITSGARFKVPKAGQPLDGADPEQLLVHGKVFPAAELMELVGWWLAEGYWQSCGVSLCQAVGEGADQIDRLIQACGLNPTRAERPDPRGYRTMVTWYFGVRENPEFVKWVRDKCGKGAANKVVPYPVFTMSARLKASLLNGYISGDGHRPTKRRGVVACTTSKQLYDDLMRLAVEIGTPVCGHQLKRAKDHHSPCFQINFGTDERRTVTLRGERNVTTSQYSGKIYCLTVETGAYVVRRNGKVAICGNSAHWVNKPDLGMVVWRGSRNGVPVDLIRVAKARYHGQNGMRGDIDVSFSTEDNHYTVVDMAGSREVAP